MTSFPGTPHGCHSGWQAGYAANSALPLHLPPPQRVSLCQPPSPGNLLHAPAVRLRLPLHCALLLASMGGMGSGGSAELHVHATTLPADSGEPVGAHADAECLEDYEQRSLCSLRISMLAKHAADAVASRPATPGAHHGLPAISAAQCQQCNYAGCSRYCRRYRPPARALAVAQPGRCNMPSLRTRLQGVGG
jgi:hypothetical protein